MSQAETDITRITRSGHFRLALPPALAFKLFTAVGERLWVPGWTPEILGPLPQAGGLVFLTGDGAERTIWTVIDSDPVGGRVRYSRVTPASRAGAVTIELAPTGTGCRVEVTYDLTALNADGAAALDAYAPDRFAAMLNHWRELIETMLAKDAPDLAALVA
jgi:hypothetical protein